MALEARVSHLGPANGIHGLCPRIEMATLTPLSSTLTTSHGITLSLFFWT